MVMQALVQGLMQGVVEPITYSQAIRVLGVSRAVLFPAMVPAVSILVGIPIGGEVPNAIQISGLLLVTISLMSAISSFRSMAVSGRLSHRTASVFRQNAIRSTHAKRDLTTGVIIELRCAGADLHEHIMAASPSSFSLGCSVSPYCCRGSPKG
jgi:hypothetical protein